MCVCERERQAECVRVCERERERLCVCECVCAREREREREREACCVRVHPRTSMIIDGECFDSTPAREGVVIPPLRGGGCKGEVHVTNWAIQRILVPQDPGDYQGGRADARVIQGYLAHKKQHPPRTLQ